MGAYQRTIRPNGLPALLRRAGDCAAASIRGFRGFLYGWAAVKRWGASRFGYSAGAFRVLCHAFRCCDSMPCPSSHCSRLPGCSINPSKSRGGTPDPCGAFSKGSPTSNVRAIPFRVAVGARVTPRPPHGSVRAPLCIRLLPRVPDGETLVGPGVKDWRLWEPVVRQLRHSSPGETAFLTASAECPAPAFGDLGSEGPHAHPGWWGLVGVWRRRVE